MTSTPFCRPVLPGLLVRVSLVASLARTRAAGDEPKPADLSVSEILDRMAKVYAGCKTYRDSGVVKTLFLRGNGKQTIEKSFTTAFVRPGGFRFEYQEGSSKKPRRYIIWSNGKQVLTWWDVKPGVKKIESLDLAVGAATGVSGGSAKNIPSLLLPEMESWRRLTEITQAKRIEDVKLGKFECFRVEGLAADHQIKVWIDKKSYLVRQIGEEQKFDNFRTEKTTTYDPSIDAEITDKMLEFDAPVEI